MTDKTCASCRFAGLQRDNEVWDPTADGGDGALVTTEHVRCTLIVHGNGSDEKRATPGTIAYVADGSGYAATLMVLPTFGCVLHEAQP